VIQAGEPLMLDFHSMFKLALGDHSHNYLIGPATPRQRWHADNFVALVHLVLDNYRAGASPASLAQVMMDCAEERGCADFIVPGCEHGIGLFGDEWRIGAKNDGPVPYWTDPDHVYQENEMVICAMQYASPSEGIGFRYENPILINKNGCEYMSKYPLAIEEIV
jgi:Xaa-Pro aminopeptidase